MEFFYEKFSKVKNNLIIFLTIIGIIMINDIVIWKFSTSKSKVNQKDNDIQLSYKDEIDKSCENDNLSSKEFMIDVKGEVKNPGVYLVNEQMNVNDAIKLAGGIKKSASTDTINLSRKLKDQMVIIVPKKDTNKQTNTNNITSNDNISKNNSNQFIKQEDIKNDALIVQNDLINNSTQANEQSNLLKDSNQDQVNQTGLVSLNNATLEELLTLPGIGESKAQKIMEYRNTNFFNTIEDVKNVSGIGDALFEKIKPYITV